MEEPARITRKELLQKMSEDTYAILQAFQDRGYKVTIQHERPTFMEFVSRTGGRTIAHIHKVIDMDGEGKREISFSTHTGISYCSKKETFCKKKGAYLAVTRAAHAWRIAFADSVFGEIERNEDGNNDNTRTVVSGSDSGS